MTALFEEAPEGGDKLEFEKVKGCTVLIFPKSTGRKDTKFGTDKEYVRADVVILTNKTGGKLAEPISKNGVFLWGGFIVGSLRDMIGRTVLAKIEQGTDDSKGNPPWLLGKFNDADAKLATEYLNARREEAKATAASGESEDDPFA